MFQQPCSYSHLWIKAPWFIEGWNVNVCIAHHSHSLDPLSHLTSIAQPFSPSFRHRKQLLKDTWTFRLNEICYILELLNNRLVSAQTPVPGLYQYNGSVSPEVSYVKYWDYTPSPHESKYWELHMFTSLRALPHNTILICQTLSSFTLCKEHFAILSLPIHSAAKKKTFCQIRLVIKKEILREGEGKSATFLTENNCIIKYHNVHC